MPRTEEDQTKTLCKQLEAETGGKVIIITILDIRIALQQFQHINNHQAPTIRKDRLLGACSLTKPSRNCHTNSELAEEDETHPHQEAIGRPSPASQFKRVLLKLEILLIGRVQTQCSFEGEAGAHGVNNDHD